MSKNFPSVLLLLQHKSSTIFLSNEKRLWEESLFVIGLEFV